MSNFISEFDYREMHKGNENTLVTMLYDLSKLENNNIRKSLDYYLKKAEDVMMVPVNIIFFVENDYIKSKIFNFRHKHSLLDKTKIIVKPFENWII